MLFEHYAICKLKNGLIKNSKKDIVLFPEFLTKKWLLK